MSSNVEIRLRAIHGLLRVAYCLASKVNLPIGKRHTWAAPNGQVLPFVDSLASSEKEKARTEPAPLFTNGCGALRSLRFQVK